MPTSNSAKKRLKTAEQNRIGNVAVKSRVRSTRTKLYAVIDGGDKEQAEALFRTYCSALDKAVKRGVIKANASGRRKSAASKRLAAV